MPHIPDDFETEFDVGLPHQPRRSRDLSAIPVKRPSGTAVTPSPKSSLLPKKSLTPKLSIKDFEFQP